MRIVLALVLVVVILGGTQLFLSANQSQPITRIQHVDEAASGKFRIEVVPMFDCGPDEFALDIDSAPSLVVRVGDKVVLTESTPIASGDEVVADVPGLIVGRNELYLQATASDGDPNKIRGLRVRVLRDEMVVAEQWLSSEPGAPVEGPVAIDIKPTLDKTHTH